MSSVAMAYPKGATGRSGMTTKTCNSCHKGGPEPTVTLTGPSSVLPGSTNTYRLIIEGGAAVEGGMNVAVSDPSAMLIEGEGTKVSSGELTQRAPQPFSDNLLFFDFQVQAPTEEGPITLFAIGNSCDGDGGTRGDNAATTTLDVTVASTPTPPTPSPSPDPEPMPPQGTEPTPTPPPETSPAPAPEDPSVPAPEDTSVPAPEDTSAPLAEPQPLIEDSEEEPAQGCTAAGGALAPMLMLGWAAVLRRRRKQARSRGVKTP